MDLIKKILFLFVIFYLLQLIIGSFVIYTVYINQTKSSLSDMTKRVQEDIKYQNGKWDTSEYYADPDVPSRFRLYVFSSDGFVIDRWRPLPGLLDTSDFKHLLAYQAPQTIHTITNQDWRMFSSPIIDENKNIVGVISTSYF